MHIVIIGGLHHNTLGVIRSLGEASISPNNLRILLIGHNIPRTNFISKCKYIRKNSIDYLETEQGIFDWLTELSKDCIRRVVICCSDGAAEAVISHEDELKEWFDTPTTTFDIKKLMSKEVQGCLARECGLVVPMGKIVSTHTLVEWDAFPCITKPVKSVEGAGKADIHISKNMDELKQALQSTDAEYVQIQQYVDKEMEYQLIGCSLNAGQRVIIPGYTRIIRQPPNTNTGYLQYSPIKDFHGDFENGIRFIRSIGYSGLFSLEFIRGKDGIDYFLEINMRNDGNAYCVKTAGINLPYVWCYYQSHKELPNIDLEFEKPVYFIPDFLDLRMGVHSVGIIRWVIQFFQAKSHSLFNWRDMKPFFFEVGQRIIKLIKSS